MPSSKRERALQKTGGWVASAGSPAFSWCSSADGSQSSTGRIRPSSQGAIGPWRSMSRKCVRRLTPRSPRPESAGPPPAHAGAAADDDDLLAHGHIANTLPVPSFAQQAFTGHCSRASSRASSEMPSRGWVGISKALSPRGVDHLERAVEGGRLDRHHVSRCGHSTQGKRQRLLTAVGDHDLLRRHRIAGFRHMACDLMTQLGHTGRKLVGDGAYPVLALKSRESG